MCGPFFRAGKVSMCFFQESMAFTEKNHANASNPSQLCCEGSEGSEACLHGRIWKEEAAALAMEQIGHGRTCTEKAKMREIRRKRV